MSSAPTTAGSHQSAIEAASQPDRRTLPDWQGSALRAFARVVADAPDRTAAIDETRQLSYAELDRRSQVLAATMIDRGVAPGDHVGVLLPRGVDILVAIIAILRIGAVYVPFDPEQPARRLDRHAREADLRLMVSQAALAATAPGAVRDVLLAIDTLADSPREVAVVDVDPDSTAYIIFTSGSTGSPKGVEVSHRSLVAFLNGMEQGGYFSAPGARVAWNASVAFDASVQEWARVLRGDTIGVLSDDMRRDPDEFADFVREHRLTDIDFTPSHGMVLIDALAEVARESHPLRLIVAGEAVPAELWRTIQGLIRDGVVRAANLYGPTETTVNVLGTMIRDGDPVTIGRPLAGVEVRVVDASLTPVAPGESGELCIAGPYVAKGYIGQPGLTALKFAPDPLAQCGERMYRTGDRVHLDIDGAYRYLGRTDHQVKIRGHRVELGEVEAVMAEHPSVSRAVVFHGIAGADQLTAVVSLEPGGDLAPVRAHVETELPVWMRPAHYHVIDAVPLTTAGKTDRTLLRQQLPSTT